MGANRANAIRRLGANSRSLMFRSMWFALSTSVYFSSFRRLRKKAEKCEYGEIIRRVSYSITATLNEGEPEEQEKKA